MGRNRLWFASFSPRAGQSSPPFSPTETVLSAAGVHPVRDFEDHTSSQKHVKTSAALREVSALLRGRAPPPPTIQRQQTFQASGTASYTSSIRRFKMGKSPNVTPEDNATYRVRQSPSAESEEFLKLDISIRGGTSYLPSEARRIHTPPLPSEDLTGKRRGFFFDYNAPFGSTSPTNNVPAPVPTPVPAPTNEARVQHRRPSGKVPSSKRSESRATTFSRKRYSTKGKKRVAGRGFRAGLGADWHETQLAEWDADESDPAGYGSECSSSSAEEDAGVLMPELRMDLSIPEHLPSSPLCPRNLRYWRVVQRKGSQFRGCWMHR